MTPNLLRRCCFCSLAIALLAAAAWAQEAGAPAKDAASPQGSKSVSAAAPAEAAAEETPFVAESPFEGVAPEDAAEGAATPAANSEQAPAAAPASSTPSRATASGRTSVPVAAASAAAERKLTFNFRFQPWKEVLDWFAQQADLSLVMEAPPAGTFNYHDSKSYTPSEAIDLLNSVLLTKGYTLVRRERMLMLVNIEDGIPPNLTPTVSLDELKDRGKFELVSVFFRPRRMSPEEADVEIKKLLGPQGSAVVLTKAGQVLVTDTAGRLRAIQSMLQSVDEPDDMLADGIRSFPLEYATAEEAAKVVKQLLNIPDDQNGLADGSLRIAVDIPGRRILASGKPDVVRRVEAIIRTVDVPAGGDALNQALQLEVYPILGADPATTLQVMQTLLAGRSDVRLTTDTKTGSLVALARASDHATIRATLDQMQQGGGFDTGDLPNLRIVPLSGRSSQSVLNQLESLWPTMRANKIRMVTPSSAISTMRLYQDRQQPDPRDVNSRFPSGAERTRPATGAEARERPEMEDEPASDELTPAAGGDDTTAVVRAPRFLLAQGPSAPRRRAAEPEADIPAADDEELPPIIVAPGPNGIVIACEDPEVLDQFEQLVQTLASQQAGGAQQYTVFYLKYAKAQTVGELLGQIFTGSLRTVDEEGSGGGIAQVASAVTSSLLGGASATQVSIIPDTRLNALFVQGPQADLDTIEQLLRVLDQETSPEDVELTPRPRLIPVTYTSADAVATVVRQVYADRIGQASGSGGQQRQPTPEDFMAMFRGGGGERGGNRGGRGNTNTRAQDDTMRMTVGVDARSNSLVVAAPEPLFREVEALVAELDQPGDATGQSMSVIALKRADPATLQKALTAISGGAVQSSSTPAAGGGVTAATTTTGQPQQGGASGQPGGQANAEDVQRRMEFWQRMREGGGGGGDQQGGGGEGGGRRGRGGRGGRGG